ncbi:MAG: hypothetical protein HY650_01005 [Acidobacteria bacterium]|nr:hypothetical protein [Acidobacteriota bacterium]
MTRRLRTGSEAIERDLELALQPGCFISDQASSSFVSDLEDVATGIARLTSSEPARAATLFETFLAGCYEKAEEVDDSSGSFGQFVCSLYCAWIECRKADGADPDETASRLLAWMESDEYGFSYQLEKHAAKVFDKANLATFVLQAREKFDAAADTAPRTGDARKDGASYLRGRWGSVLRTLYATQKDIAAYVALTEETGLTVQDCFVIATLLVTRRKPKEALAWVDRGIDLDKKTTYGSMAGDDLAKLRRQLLTRLGRGNEALDAAWADYHRHPSKYTYDELMKFVPKADRAKWHDKAIAAAEGGDLHAVMDLLLATKETGRLINLVSQVEDPALEGLSHYATEPVARTLEKTRPDLAARLWRAQGMRIINAGKSKYYYAALSNFERAKRCYQRAGLIADWEKTVSRIRSDHRRKTGFMTGFERLVAGSGPSDEPSFLDRAKARWKGRPRSAG